MTTTFSGINKSVVTNDFFTKSVETHRKHPLYTHAISLDSISSLAEPPKPVATMICFHGSPGCEEDFYELKNHLSCVSLYAYPRKNYPGFSNTFLDCLTQKKNQILVGYSWGCRELLEYCAKNHSNTEMVIMISPYILNSSKSALSTLSRLIVGVIKRILMTLENKLSNNYTINHNNDNQNKHTLLKRSLLYLCGLYEKSEHQVISYASILRLIAELDIPVHIITGTSEVSTHSQQSIELIRAINRNVVCHLVNGENNDILKTHVHQIARILKLITQSQSETNQMMNK